MGRTLADKMAALTTEQRARVEARADELEDALLVEIASDEAQSPAMRLAACDRLLRRMGF